MNKGDLTQAMQIVLAVGDAIRELGEVPSGHLYARLMGQMSLENYQGIVKVLKGAGLVEESGNVLRWTGPAKEEGR